MPVSLFERELIQKCCDGNRIAYRDFYDLLAGEMLAIAMRYMKSQEEGEDVLQESFIKAFKSLGAFDQRASLKTWMTRIVINTALNMLRKDHKKYIWSIDELKEVEDQVIPLEKFHFQQLLKIIQGLPLGCKTVFNLYAIEGYSHKEIAEMLKISQGTSKSQYSRAKSLLQQQIYLEEETVKKMRL